MVEEMGSTRAEDRLFPPSMGGWDYWRRCISSSINGELGCSFMTTKKLGKGELLESVCFSSPTHPT